MPMSKEDQLDRIRKLLAKSEAAGVTPEEAASLRDKAFELATRYEIDEALLRGQPGAEKETVINRIFDLGRPYAQQITLAYHIYDTFGCKLIDISLNRAKARKYRTAPRPGRVHAFGFKSDMARADMLLTSLILQAANEAVRRYREYLENFAPWSCLECGGIEYAQVPHDEDWYYCVECHREFSARRPPADKPDRRSVWYRSFWIGWTDELVTRVRAAHKKVQDQAVQTVGTGAEVALRSRDLAVKTSFEESYPTVRSRRERGSKGSGYEQGRDAGRNADIGQDRIGAKRSELSK